MKRFKLWFAAALLSGASLAVAPLNRPITTGDRLWADRDGRAEFRVGPNAMRIGTMTSLDVLRLDDEVTHLRLAQGTLLVRLRRLDSGDSFEISTPSGAVLLTRPGLYRVAVDGSGMPTTVLVREGQADVLSGNAPLSLNANQYVTLSTADPAFGAAPAADEFERWAYARDNPPQPVAATRYVHPDMTGHEDLDQHGTWHAEPQYGSVWIPTAAALPVGWAPYRYGRWVWVSPWGWTWVDNAPWGFAPYHYGRWVWLGHRWAWAPGPRAARPVYAPALVAFVGGHNWSVSVASGPSVAWVPLGWREPYIPWYRHSPRYVRNVNVTHVTNVTVINQYTNVNNVTRVRYVNRDVPSATTVVTRDTFVRARHVHEARIDAPARALAAAPVTHAAPVVLPERQSLLATQPGVRLPATVATREVIAAREPVAPARLVPEGAARHDKRANDDDRPRVRVLQAQHGKQPSHAEAGAGDKRADGAPPPGFAPKGVLGSERKAEGTADKAQPRAEAKAGDDAAKRSAVAMPPGDRERAAERAAQKAQLRADGKAGDDSQNKPAGVMPLGERERAADRSKPETETKAAADLAPKPAVTQPPGERARATLETKTGDTPQKPAVAMPPGERERAVERLRAAPDAKVDTRADAKPAAEAARPPVTTLAPADAQRLQQQQQERQAREEQQRQARAQQEKQALEQKQQHERAAAARQQQERQARETREREAQQQQARAAQQQQFQEQQEQQRLLQQQQQRALQQQAAQLQLERQAREEQQRQLQQQRLLQQQQAAQQQQERHAREEQQRQARAQQQQQREQQAQFAQQQADQQRRAAERQQRRAADNPGEPPARNKPKPLPEQIPPQGR